MEKITGKYTLKLKYSIANYFPDGPSEYRSCDSLYKRMFLFYNLTESGK